VADPHTNSNTTTTVGQEASSYRLADFDTTPEPAPPDVPRLAGDPLPNEPRTDLGYAHRLVEAYGTHLRYVATWGQWLVWDGRRWAPDITGQAKRWAKAIARTVTTDALTIGDADRRKAAFKEAKRGESSSAINGALTLASTETEVVCDHEQLDADPYLLNCVNGTLNLRTGHLHPHNPDDLLTKLTGAAYHPPPTGATLTDVLDQSRFGRFLTEIQPGADNDPAAGAEMRAYLARLLGHALVGQLVEHILPIFWGDGANGKSTLLDVVLAALGDYAGMAAPGLLTARNFDAHPTEIADLFGLRLARLDETDEGRRLAEGTVKRLTGDRRQKARRMRENFWEFDASHTFIMLTNHKPLVNGTDEGIWRRLRLIPFTTVIPEHQRDETLPDTLSEETHIVLAWLVHGCTAWQTNGLDDPDTVADATAAYRAESDAIGRFLDERCNLHPAFRTQSAHLFTGWTRWCVGEGLDPGTNKAFTSALEERGYDRAKSSGRMVWNGITLATDNTDSDDEPQ
jgi:putative DNA primase/helicase